MKPRSFVHRDRAVLAIRGEEASDFLQGLVTNDIRRLTPESPLFAALLSPQGKLMADFLLVSAPSSDATFLDLPSDCLDDVAQMLTRYRLRRKVEIAALEDMAVTRLFGTGAREAAGLPSGAVAAEVGGGRILLVDPRDPRLGLRMYGSARDRSFAGDLGFAEATAADWHAHRIALRVPETGVDFPPASVFPLEVRMAEMNGMDFRKGCYVGQEVTARMHHRSAARRAVHRVGIAAERPAGTRILSSGRAAGTLFSSDGRGRALAQLRGDRISPGSALEAGGASLTLEDNAAT